MNVRNPGACCEQARGVADWIGVDVARLTVLERIAARSHAAPPPPHVPADLGDCLVWDGYRDNKGYGRINIGQRMKSVHRTVWVLRYGEIPPETPCVLHRCDNPPCCNVGHLFLGTVADNNADMIAKGRNRRGPRYRNAIGSFYPCGHPRTDENTRISMNGAGRTSRGCRICAREIVRRWKAKQKEIRALPTLPNELGALP
jgi:hypothetical protein